MNKIAVLYDAGQAVLSTFDLDEVLQRILAIARDYFHVRNVAIVLLDEQSKSFAVTRLRPFDRAAGLRIHPSFRLRFPVTVRRIKRGSGSRAPRN